MSYNRINTAGKNLCYSCKIMVMIMYLPELQIRGGIEDNSKVFFLITERKPMLLPLIQAISMRWF